MLSDARPARFLRRLILKRGRVQVPELFGAARASHLLVEALVGLVAQPVAAQHALEQSDEPRRRQDVAIRVVGQQSVQILAHVIGYINPSQVSEPEGAHLRPADQLAGQCIHLFDRVIMGQPIINRVRSSNLADAVGDEVGRVFAYDHALAQAALAETLDEGHGVGEGIGRRDHFDQFHIARRIEEVGAHEVLAKVQAATFGNLVNEQARCVARDETAGATALVGLTAHGVNARHQRLLHLQLLYNHLDDPVSGGDRRVEVILQVAELNQVGSFSREQVIRLGLHQTVKTGLYNPVACFGIGHLGRFEVRRHNVQQCDRNTRVRQVSRNRRAHRPSPNHRRAVDFI